MISKTEIFRLKWLLILFASGLWCDSSIGDTNNAIIFEKPPAKLGSVQWDNNQHLTKQRQESYRKRVLMLPDAFGKEVPHADGLNPASNSTAPVTKTTSPLEPVFLRITVIATPSTGIVYRTLFLPQETVDTTSPPV